MRSFVVSKEYYRLFADELFERLAKWQRRHKYGTQSTYKEFIECMAQAGYKIHFRTLGKYLDGMINPSRKAFTAICEVLRCEEDEFIESVYHRKGIYES